MFGRIKELFSYFMEALRTFFGKFILSVLACLIYYSMGPIGSMLHDSGISHITSDIREFMEHDAGIVEAFNYDPGTTIFLGIILAIAWIIGNAIFEIFTYHAVTSKGKTRNLKPFIFMVREKLLVLLKANILKMTYVIISLVPLMACLYLGQTLSKEDGSSLLIFAKVGNILLIIPALIVILRYYSSTYFVLSKGSKPHEALKESTKITYNYKLPLCVFLLLIFVLMGLLVSITASFGLFSPEMVGMLVTILIRPMVSVLGYYTMYVFSMRRDRKG